MADDKRVQINLRGGETFQSKQGFTTTVRKITEGEPVELLPSGRVFVNLEALASVVEEKD